LQEVLAANEAYTASFGDKGKLAMPPARRFAILTCMDARLDPAKYAGVCTENSVRLDYVTESPNVSGDDRSVVLLPDPVRLAVQVEEPT
jgi:hypothetical protein